MALNISLITGSENSVAKQDTKGRLKVNAHTDSEIIIWSKDNPLAPRVAADYEPRTTALIKFEFPHMWTHYPSEGYTGKDYRDIFEQSFTIVSTLDVAIDVVLLPSLYSTTADIGTTELYSIALGTIGAVSGATPKKMTIAPEVTDLPVTRTEKIISLPELRQPFPCFYINITPQSTPTTGDIKIIECRRY